MLSDSEPKIDKPTERYILTAFAAGAAAPSAVRRTVRRFASRCNLGANQMARHAKRKVSSHALSYTNRRHVSSKKLEAAIRDIINSAALRADRRQTTGGHQPAHRFNLPKIWGTEKRAATDGTKFNIYENNLVAEYHIRYGGYGGIAYHHVADNYIALFTHFITCGVWEAVYILDGLLKNTSDIQPDTFHADTQGQSGTILHVSRLNANLLFKPKNGILIHKFFEVASRDTNPSFSPYTHWQITTNP